MFYKLKKAVLDLLFPVKCAGCAKIGGFICDKCFESLRWIHPQCFVCGRFSTGSGRVPAGRTCPGCGKRSHIYCFLSPFFYNDVLARELIHSFKYNRVKSLGDFLADMLLKYFDRYGISLPGGAILAPIPLHQSRLRTRGFNQSELIAASLSEKLIYGGKRQIRVDIGLLKRIKKTAAQVELSGSKRVENVSGAFGVDKDAILKDRTVLLLDDVKTTGATLEEAARVLKLAGAKRVWAITVAH